MPLLGNAALAMWWDVAEEVRAEWETWHSREHFPERLGLPGFLRGSRWRHAEGGGGYFQLYELEAYETLVSPAYRARLDDPTPWSRQMMPQHRNMVRSQCRVLASAGAGLGGALATVRLSPAPGRAEALLAALRALLPVVAEAPGMVGAHLLRTDTPDAPPTEEQKIRGGDGAADWIVLASGHTQEAVRAALTEVLGADGLRQAGAAAQPTLDVYRLAHAVTPADFQRGTP
jgi:hypothetical protein